MGDLGKIQELIEKERSALEDALAVALEKRDVANREVKRIRAELDAAPRLHVKRSKKPRAAAVTVESMTAVIKALDESLKADEGRGAVVTLPSALEMFPHGIERAKGSDDV